MPALGKTIMTKIALLPFLVVAGCAEAPEIRQATGATVSCIASDQIVARRAAGANSIDFEMVGGALYRNQLVSVCPGLERLGATAVISLDVRGQGSQLCRGDRVLVYDPVEVKATGRASFPHCSLGQFVALRLADIRLLRDYGMRRDQGPLFHEKIHGGLYALSSHFRTRCQVSPLSLRAKPTAATCSLAT